MACNFCDKNSKQVELTIPDSVISQWQLGHGVYPLVDKLKQQDYQLRITERGATISLSLAPLATHFICLDNLPLHRG